MRLEKRRIRPAEKQLLAPAKEILSGQKPAQAIWSEAIVSRGGIEDVSRRRIAAGKGPESSCHPVILGEVQAAAGDAKIFRPARPWSAGLTPEPPVSFPETCGRCR
jgi:hypothetical protein